MEGYIDFVITWVDGNDPAWQEEKARYDVKNGEDAREERYRDWGFLKFWLRGVEQCAPWARKVHLVTWGHVPKWLNTDCKKLHIVRHEEIIPQRYLPVFNSSVIEMFLCRIEGLSEKFVYFNDDMLLIDRIEPGNFFRHGIPYDMLALQPVIANPKNEIMSNRYLNNSLVLARHFDKRKNMRAHPGNYFHIGYPPKYFCYNLLELAFPQITGFYTVHGPMPFLKSTYRTVWKTEKDTLLENASHRFRNKEDVTIYLFREWQKLSGRFKPRNMHRHFAYFNLDDHNSRLLRTIRRRKKAIICVNDANKPVDFIGVKAQIEEALLQIFPKSSEFEKE